MERDNQSDPESQAVDCPDFVSHASLAGRMLRPGEDPHEFKKLYDELSAECRPSNIAEWYYFERIVSHRWTLGRLQALEASIFEQIGRAAWGHNTEPALQEVWGPELPGIRAAIRGILKTRTIRTKSLTQAVRGMKREQSRPERKAKPALAAKSRGSKIVDLEPLTRSIQ